MPEKAVYIGPMAFNNCSSLKRFDIPEGIRYVNNALLFGASSLEAVTIPEGIVYIGDGAFAHTALEAVVIPEGTERINSLFIREVFPLRIILKAVREEKRGAHLMKSCLRLLQGIPCRKRGSMGFR